MNRLEKKIEQIFSKRNSSIGFGNSSINKVNKKILLLIESDKIKNDFKDSIDGLLLTKIDIDNLEKVKGSNLIGIKYPDKIIDINEINQNNYDFVIIDNQELSYKYLDNNLKTIYKIDEYSTDDDSDILSSFEFPVLFVEFEENFNFDYIKSYFKLSKITSKFNSNFFIKINKILSTDKLQLLFNLGVIGIILDSKISTKKNISDLNKNLMGIDTEKKKVSNAPDISFNLSSSIEDEFDE